MSKKTVAERLPAARKREMAALGRWLNARHNLRRLQAEADAEANDISSS